MHSQSTVSRSIVNTVTGEMEEPSVYETAEDREGEDTMSNIRSSVFYSLDREPKTDITGVISLDHDDETQWTSCSSELMADPPSTKCKSESTNNKAISGGNNRLELFATVILWTCFPLFLWTVCYLLFENGALPRGILFSLLVLELFGLALGFVFSKIKLPPLLGMLTVGIFVRNITSLNENVVVSAEVSSVLRQVALVVILIRAGLGLDHKALLRLKGVVLRLAFLPCLAEATVIGIVTHFILGFPWMWGFLLGFVLAAVSPAVVVPSLLLLSDKGYGVAKGIPTLVIAASSVDDILAISFFGITLGFALSQGSLVTSLIQGPVELAIGIGFGILFGLLLGFPYTSYRKEWEYVTLLRTFSLLAVGIIAVFGSQYIEYPGAGALACLLASFVAAVNWRRNNVLEDNDALCWNYSFLWLIFQPMLFSLIGREINLNSLDSRIIGLGLLCVFIALVVRLIVSYLAVNGANFSVREKCFIAISWIPKATVQAAIGPVALDTARKLGSGEEAERLGLEVLTIAVLVILITAPVGAIAIAVMGPKLLSNDSKREEDANNGNEI